MSLAPCLPRNRPNRQAVIARSVSLLPEPSVSVSRILGTYDLATDDERALGAAWYPEAYDVATLVSRTLTERTGVPLLPEHGAGIIAALSPQCSWDENIARAIRLATGHEVGAFDDALRKAHRIAEAEDPLAVLGGRKVRSFYRNILGLEHYVTVDRHAVAIVHDRPLTDAEIKVLERHGAYAHVAACYRGAARIAAVPPSTLQAVTWVTWRRLKAEPDLGEF